MSRPQLSSHWYYARDGRAMGPFSAEALQVLARNGELSVDDLVWQEGMVDWESAASMGLGFADTTAPPLPNPGFPAFATAPALGARRAVPRLFNANRNSYCWILFVAVLLPIVGVGGYWLGRDNRFAMQDESSRPASTKKTVRYDNYQNRREERVVTAKPNPIVPAKIADAGTDRSLEPTEPFVADAATKTLSSSPPQIADKNRDSVSATKVSAPREAELTPNVRPAPLPPQTSKAAVSPRRILLQQVEILRRPHFYIQGLETAQEIRYRMLSRLEVELQADGSRNVVQYVQDAELITADDLSRDTFAKSLERLKNHQFSYTLNPRGDVIEFTGHKDNLEAISVALPAAQGFAMTSVIDNDGWKELAALTFLTPDPQVSANQPWRRQITHDWGPLGTWAGITTLRRRGTVKGIQEIEYSHYLKYTKPKDAIGKLPFKIADARFEPQKAGGRLEFDIQNQQVRSAQELFEVSGVVTAELLGQTVEIRLSEQQVIEIRIRDQRTNSSQQ